MDDLEISAHASSQVPCQVPSQDRVLTPAAKAFLLALHQQFEPERQALLKRRQERQHLLDSGHYPGLSSESQAIRSDRDWQIAPIPQELAQRWVEIVTPPEKKRLVQALNSGASSVIVDFEEATSPTWENLIEGQAHLIEAIENRLSYTTATGEEHKVKGPRPPLFCRPRGWHLSETHVRVKGRPFAASLFDFGLYVFHNAFSLLQQNSAPYFLLPKLEGYLEARLWKDIFLYTERTLNLPLGILRATIAIENVLALFEMEEILWELKEYSAGLSAGHTSYIFSLIAKLNKFPLLFPNRDLLNPSLPFLTTFNHLLVRIGHKRGAHAIGSLSTFIPSHSDAALNKIAFSQVHDIHAKEASQGFDGARTAHPALVSLIKAPFQKASGLRLNQIRFPLPPLSITPKEVLDFTHMDTLITESGVRSNINLALRYFSAWFAGIGSLNINHHREDSASAELSRALLWHWHHHPKATLYHIGPLTQELFSTYLKSELKHIEHDPHFPVPFRPHLTQAATLLERLVTEKNIPDNFICSAIKDL